MSLNNSKLGTSAVQALLQTKPGLWFIGIGGIHMGALAQYLHARGYRVGGSDTVAGAQVQRLRDAGIPVFVGHNPARVADYDAAVYTLAIEERDPEYIAAQQLGLPLISRAELLGALSDEFPVRIGVAGSHGKSTTTAMLAAIFSEAGRKPTVFCGAPLSPETGPLQHGEGEACIFEACEYRDSFLCFSPTVAAILGIELDHVDYFPDTGAIFRAFSRFAALAQQGGTLIYNAEDALCRALAESHAGARFGFGLHVGDCHARDLQYVQGRGEFSLILQGEEFGKLRLSGLWQFVDS